MAPTPPTLAQVLNEGNDADNNAIENVYGIAVGARGVQSAGKIETSDEIRVTNGANVTGDGSNTLDQFGAVVTKTLYVTELPTELPAEPGQVWNDNGALRVS